MLALVIGGIAWALLRGDDDQEGGDKSAEDKPAGILGDRDGDGLGDVVLTQARDGLEPPSAIYTVPSNGKQFGTPVRALAGAQTFITTVGGVDGDAREDVVWVDEEDDVLTVTAQPAEGEPWTATMTLDPAWEISPASAALGDVDGDGLDDLVLIGDTEGGLGIHVSFAGQEEFEPLSQWYRSPHTEANGFGNWLWTGDMDGDGDDEVLALDGIAVEPTVKPIRGRIEHAHGQRGRRRSPSSWHGSASSPTRRSTTGTSLRG